MGIRNPKILLEIFGNYFSVFNTVYYNLFEYYILEFEIFKKNDFVIATIYKPRNLLIVFDKTLESLYITFFVKIIGLI
jgi:hypothetical protein